MDYSDRPLFWEIDKSDDGRLWFWEINHNNLFSWQQDENIIHKEIIPSYSKKNMSNISKPAHTLIKIYKNKIILIPRCTSKFLIYDLKNRMEHIVEIPEEIKCLTDSVESLFSACALNGDYLYLAGGNIPYIARLDLKSEQIDKYINLFPKEKISNNNVFFKDIQLINGKLYVCCANLNRIYLVNPDDFTFSMVIVNAVKSGFTAIRSYKEKVILFPRYADSICIWHIDENIWETIDKYPDGFSFDGNGLRELDFPIIIDNKAFIFPVLASDVLVLDLDNNDLSKDKAINQYIRKYIKQYIKV